MNCEMYILNLYLKIKYNNMLTFTIRSGLDYINISSIFIPVVSDI